jgi:A/G-specific adenine glycosylase
MAKPVHKQIRDHAAIARLRNQLLAWYGKNRRDLPWRRTRDPYAIWVSEIMLQQTRVAAVIDRYQAFMARFPTIVSLARAAEQDVLALWSGLGYYRRARMLHKAAQHVSEVLGGEFPSASAELRTLSGIGPYTAAAIASIAHDEVVAVVDGNVERVLCRVAGWEAGNGKGYAATRHRIEDLAARLVDPGRPGDFNQAMMELGATICLPRNPQCLVCPISVDCKTRGEHKTQPRPRMESREVGHALAVRAGRRQGKGSGASGRASMMEVLLEQRPEELTVMPGMWQLPALRDSRVPEEHLSMTVRHAIMQVNYVVHIRKADAREIKELTVHAGRRRWVPLCDAASMALTGLTRKVLTRAGTMPIPLESNRVRGNRRVGKNL